MRSPGSGGISILGMTRPIETVIKPKLDEALAQRQKLEVDLQKGKARLNEIQVEARRDGGEPGWFRGFDQLPTPKPTAGVMPP